MNAGIQKIAKYIIMPPVWLFSMVSGQKYTVVMDHIFDAVNGETEGARSTGLVVVIITSVLTLSILLLAFCAIGGKSIKSLFSFGKKY